jgi:hypothetical protein
MKNLMHWWTGVVEDRDDPMKMGRVRVRIFGLHTDDLDKIKISNLPWAHTMMPCTSASISGVGFSPTGLVEGSWVVGFFADGENQQDPIVMGSIHGYPTQPSAEQKAFKDSEGEYPRWHNDSDVSYVAREEKWSEHISYISRYSERVQGIEMSTKPTLATIDNKAVEGTEDTRETWDEPEPRHGAPGMYPTVHTYESETGVVKEIDDTPNGTRIVEYHPAGTWYEIFPDGSKMTKVSGDNYEIIVYDDNILVRGSSNVTVEGTARLLVKGDLIHEIQGDYHLKVHGNRFTKITQNDNAEVVGNFNLNVKEEFLTRVGSNQTLLIDGNKTESIGGTSGLTVTGKTDYIHLDTYSMFSNGAQSVSTNSTQQFLSKDGLDFGSKSDWVLTCKANMTINVDGSFNINAGPTFKVLASKVELN